jgi:calcineurin-like phosphoesterase family protein
LIIIYLGVIELRIIGDIHGKLWEYKDIIDANPSGISIQVGDFGMGFKIEYDVIQKLKGENYFIRGNHDNPEKCWEYINDANLVYIPDGTEITIDGKDILFIGGALSIDWKQRVEGVSWWRNEELSISELYDIIDKVSLRNKPYDIIISHDCPESACRYIESSYVNCPEWNSRTRHALQEVLEINRPKCWIHGHWHIAKKFKIDNTQFLSLPELGWVDL